MKRVLSLLLLLGLLLSGCGEASGSPEIDVDLTKMSATMVYSEVFNMLYTPEDYLGKTVKMDGNFTWYHDEDSGRYYYACIIQDATACCAQGMEFVLAEEKPFEDYPAEGAFITVQGTFSTYEENGYTFCTLRDAAMR